MWTFITFLKRHTGRHMGRQNYSTNACFLHPHSFRNRAENWLLFVFVYLGAFFRFTGIGRFQCTQVYICIFFFSLLMIQQYRKIFLKKLKAWNFIFLPSASLWCWSLRVSLWIMFESVYVRIRLRSACSRTDTLHFAPSSAHTIVVEFEITAQI